MNIDPAAIEKELNDLRVSLGRIKGKGNSEGWPLNGAGEKREQEPR